MTAEVTIYSTPTCQYCKMAKKFFRENKIEFRDIDVSADYKAAYEMINHTGQLSVPVIVVRTKERERILIGFNQEELTKALNIKKPVKNMITA
jgi:glutaredoxin 3